MSYFGRSHFNVSNLVFWQLGVAPGPDRLFIVEAVLCYLLEPQNLIRIVQDPVCGEIFVLYRIGQEIDILYRYNLSMDGDVVIFTMVHYL